MEKASNIGVLEEFRVDFLAFWQRLPSRWFFLGLLVVWIALFHLVGNSTLGYIRTPSLLQWLYIAYNPGNHELAQDSHGLLVPFIVLGLLWWKRDKLMALPTRNWWPGLLLLSGALLLHVLGYMVQQPKISVVALFAGIYGLVGLAWGPAWLRSTFFPFCLFAFSVPLGTQAQPITVPLQLLVCKIVTFISSNILAIDIIREGNILRDPSGKYQYEVAAACSGMRSLFATILFAVVYSAVSFRTPWKRLLLIASTFPLSILANVMRMMSIVIAAEVGGQRLGNTVHDSFWFGLFPYIPAFGGMLWLGAKLQEPREKIAPVVLQPEPA